VECGGGGSSGVSMQSSLGPSIVVGRCWGQCGDQDAQLPAGGTEAAGPGLLLGHQSPSESLPSELTGPCLGLSFPTCPKQEVCRVWELLARP
jgi:hypothetical protein